MLGEGLECLRNGAEGRRGPRFNLDLDGYIVVALGGVFGKGAGLGDEQEVILEQSGGWLSVEGSVERTVNKRREREPGLCWVRVAHWQWSLRAAEHKQAHHPCEKIECEKIEESQWCNNAFRDARRPRAESSQRVKVVSRLAPRRLINS